MWGRVERVIYLVIWKSVGAFGFWEVCIPLKFGISDDEIENLNTQLLMFWLCRFVFPLQIGTSRAEWATRKVKYIWLHHIQLRHLHWLVTLLIQESSCSRILLQYLRCIIYLAGFCITAINQNCKLLNFTIFVLQKNLWPLVDWCSWI